MGSFSPRVGTDFEARVIGYARSPETGGAAQLLQKPGFGDSKRAIEQFLQTPGFSIIFHPVSLRA
ncbi:MAG: hypothetical protein ABI180_00955 [Microcoleus sp.]